MLRAQINYFKLVFRIDETKEGCVKGKRKKLSQLDPFLNGSHQERDGKEIC